MNRRRTTSVLSVAIAVVALAGCAGDDDRDANAPTAEKADQAAAPLEIALPATAPGRCAMPNAEALSLNDVAFEGTVTRVDDVSATLEVDRWFTGDETDLVSVVLPTLDQASEGLAVDFREGTTYLVSATDQAVSLCGFTAESTPDLERLYEQAFGED
jgi:hypothetical protein